MVEINIKKLAKIIKENKTGDVSGREKIISPNLPEHLIDYFKTIIKCSCGKTAKYACECGQVLCGEDTCPDSCGGAVNPFREQFLKWAGVKE